MGRAEVIRKMPLGPELFITSKLQARDKFFFLVHKSLVIGQSTGEGENNSAVVFLTSQFSSTMNRAEVISKILLLCELFITARLQARDGFFFLVHKSSVL